MYTYIYIYKCIYIFVSIPGRVLVLHSRLVAPLGPGDGISLPYSCYIYECSYLRGPQGYSMCFENPQHPPSEKPSQSSCFWTRHNYPHSVLAHLLYCVFVGVTD